MRTLLTALSLVVVLSSCEVEKRMTIESENFEFVELGNGVYSCIHKIGGRAICNVGVVDNGKETIIFDSFLSPDVAEGLVSALATMNLSPIKYVVNSHFHNDHIRGNQVFPADVSIISTTKAKQLIEVEEPLQIAFEKEQAPAQFAYYDSLHHAFTGDKQSREFQQIQMWRPYYEILSESHLKVKTRLPDMYVDSIRNFDGPDRRVQLISKGPGHTDSDLILYLPDDKILFTGDLIFNECHPYVAHGDITKWKAWLDHMDSLEVGTIMPGHGQIGTEDLIDQMKTYLEDLEQAAEELVSNDISPEELQNISVPVAYKDWWFGRFYEYNLKFAYESINSKEPN